MNTIKSKACSSGAIAIHGLGLLGAMLLTGWATLPAVPTPPMLYDFGPASVAPCPAGRRGALPAVVLGGVGAQGGGRCAVLKADDGAAQSRGAPRSGHLLLRVELEEFSHLFNSPTQSAGVVRLRATMVERTPTGESLRGQRVFIMQKPARSADAAGGVAALAEASTQLASELAEWVEQVESTPH